MKAGGRLRKAAAKVLVALLAVTMVFTMMPLAGSQAYAESGSVLSTQTPALVVTGKGLIGNEGVYSSSNVSSEVSYTLNELKALGEGYVVNGQKYSAMKNAPFTKNYYLVDGVRVDALLGKSESEITGDVYVEATDGYKVQFLQNGSYSNGKVKTVGIDKPRYFYTFTSLGSPNGDGQYDAPEGERGEQVPALIGWADTFTGLNNGDVLPTGLPEGSTSELGFLRLYVGQLGEESGGAGAADRNQPLFNGKDASTQIYKVSEGDTITETVLTIGSKSYTRAEVLMMDFAEAAYTYSSNSGEKTDEVRGVPMSVLLKGESPDSVVSFEAADGYDMSSYTKTVQELIDGNYMLAYEANGKGIYKTAKSDPSVYGLLTLYGEGVKPASMVNKISVTTPSGIDFSTSPYKHITNGGQSGDGPYNIDAITGATLTVEGPGVKTSVPVSVRDLEGRDSGAARADYTDKREGSNITRTYEGIDLHYILHGMTSGDNGIQMTDQAKKVLIKNRNRNTIAEFTVEQVEEAHNSGTPILVAYGTSYTSGDNPRPFVFNNAAGADPELGNEDGCIKLVYNKDSITGDTNTGYTKFGNMAYIYVAEAETPGYKHNKDPYQSPEISNYVLTVTGDKIGREVNYTVKQLEDMVAYGDDGKPDNSGMGYRDEYSLANSTYWYVNEYEGVQLWKLLLRSGLDESLKDDAAGKNIEVSSTATDGYAATDRFTVEQVANPDLFGFYEKNPADLNDGTYEGNENIRQGDDVSTGDKLRVGYPVLVAYGVNGYPYVEKSSQAGYLSGLQNDGGPLRVISGKKVYNHPNGSNQAKLLDKVIVGDNTYHYSTHKYHSDAVYNGLADNEISVKILNGADADAPVLKEKTYTIGDIEELIYGGKLSRNQLMVAKIKQFYELTKGTSAYSDLYEGINLNFFLENIVELPGYKGTITFSDGTNELALNLEDVLATDNGINNTTGVDGLVPVLAYGKNGAPMVLDKNAEGYQNKIKLGEGTAYENEISVKNDGGPLAVLFPNTDSSVSGKTLTNVTSITINLSADNYSHTKAPYDAYADYVVSIGGEGTRLGAEGKDFALSDLEGKQTIAFTGDYSILKSDAGSASQERYRGIKLYSLLTSSDIGLKSNADKVIVTTSDGESKEFSLSEIRNTYVNTVTGEDGMPVLLAYGKGIAGGEDKEDGLPLVSDKTSDGFDSAYGNNGGPVRLVVGQTEAGDVNSGKNLKFVKSIEVTASEMTSWNHNSSEVYKQYRNETVDLIVNDKSGNELFKKTFTVGEIEDNTSLVERVVATVTQEFTWEGINFWGWVKQEAGSVEGLDDPVSVTVTAADTFSQEIRNKFGMDALNTGIKDGNNYVPIILAYGVGGYPLVIGDKSYPNGEGYDAAAMNNGGPLRLVTHNSQGTSITYVKKIVVVAGDGSGSEPEEPADFTIKGLKSGDIELTVDDIRNLKNSAGDNVGQAEGEYVVKGTTKKVKGALLKNVLATNGVENENTVMTLNTPDGFETTGKGASYNNITLKQAVEQKYFLAYQEWDAAAGEWKDIDDIVKNTDIHTNLRMYRNYCNATEGVDSQTDWYDECTNVNAITLEVPESVEFKEYPTSGGVRSTWMDKDGTIWVGTYGGGLYCKKAGESDFTVMNTSGSPALQTNFTSAVAADEEGGIWVSQNASYTDPTNNQGVLYIKDGEITQYTVEANPGTIPNNYVQAIKVDADGKVWFGSFGGLTIFDPAAGTWTTYSKADKDFPASSINTIVLDGEGGAWLGFYPDGSGTAEDPYKGGFCHITKDGTVDKSKVETGDSAPMFAQIWVRSIAIDQKGTVWAVAAGTNLDDNVGGVIWKWKSGNAEPERYTGKEVLGDYLDGSSTTEVRVVAVDAEGSLWFGTSADGVLKVENPKLVDGKMTVAAQYAKETGSWSAANMNNVYSIDFWNGGTAYVGTSGGLLVLGDEPAAPSGPDPAEEAEKKKEEAEEARQEAEEAAKAADEAQAAAEEAAAAGGDEAIEAAQSAEEAAETALDKAEAAEEAAKAALEAAQATGDEALIAEAAQAAEAAHAEKMIAAAKVALAKTTSAKAKAANAASAAAAAAATPGEDAVKAAKEAEAAAKEEVEKAAQAVEAAEAAVAAAGDGASKEKAQAVLDSAKAAKAAADKALAAAELEEVREEAKKSLIEMADAAKEGISEETAAAIDADLQAALAQLSEARSISSIAPISAKFANDINSAVEAEKQKAASDQLADKKAKAMQSVIDYLNEKLIEDEEAAMTRSALESIVAISNASDAGAVDTITGNATAAIDKIAADYKEATTPPAKPVIKTKNIAKRKAKVTWKKINGAVGYEVYRSTKKTKGFKKVKTVKSGSTVKYTSGKLKKGKTYYFKVRAYKVYKGKKIYSKYSKVKKVKIKK